MASSIQPRPPAMRERRSATVISAGHSRPRMGLVAVSLVMGAATLIVWRTAARSILLISALWNLPFTGLVLDSSHPSGWECLLAVRLREYEICSLRPFAR